MPLTKEQQILLFTNLARAMAVDRMMMRVIRAGRMVGFLRKDDAMWPHYRAHSLAHTLSKGIDVKHYVAKHMGRETGSIPSDQTQTRSSYQQREKT